MGVVDWDVLRAAPGDELGESSQVHPGGVTGRWGDGLYGPSAEGDVLGLQLRPRSPRGDRRCRGRIERRT